MSRDSEIIHELVASKYKIAERNRLAKIKFLSNTSVDKMSDNKRRDSEPSLAQTEKVEVRPVDLSVPGTPVSSRYLRSLRKTNKSRHDIETDSEDDDDEDFKDKADDKQRTFNQELQEGLKQFTSDMAKLQQQTASHDPVKQEEESEAIAVKKEPALSRVEQYFKESARRGSLTRDFTEVVQKFDPKLLHEDGQSKPGTPVSSKITRPEKVSSTKLGSFGDNMKKLEALRSPDVVKQADEQLKTPPPPEKPRRVNPVPLTPTVTPPSPLTFDKSAFPPVSSAAIQTIDKTDFPPVSSKPDAAESDSSGSSAVIVDKKDFPPVSSTSIQTIEKKDFPPVSSQAIQPAIEVKSVSSKAEPVVEQIAREETKQDAVKKPFKRTESNVSEASNKSEISVPGTPVDSRRLFSNKTIDDFSDDDSDMEIIDSSEVSAMAQEFVEKIETLVQKTMDEEEKGTVADSKKVEESDEAKGGEHKLLIIQEQASGNKVKDYFDQSQKDMSYQRTFSEVESFNVPSLEVKEKVEKFFQESQEKKSLTRGFSEAVNYIEPIDIEKLFQPGTPVSSKTVACLKKEILGDEIIEEEREIDPVAIKGIEAFQKAHDALHKPPPDFKVNDYFEESKERHTLKRDFSEVYGELGGSSNAAPAKEITNPNIQKFFEESDAQKSFRRQFSEAFQTLPPRIKDILVEQHVEKQQQKPGRSESIFSAPPDCTDTAGIAGSKKNPKKYGIDKYFAASLYRTAYHRNNAERRGSEPNHRLAILEDEYVFGETDALRSQVFQDDDETPIHATEAAAGGDYEQQTVQFWRDFLKPYTLNLPTDIVMRDELIDKYTKYTLE